MKRCLKILLLCFLTFSTVAEARLPPIKPGVPGKKRGEIIAPLLDEQIAAWCDFSKQIVVTRSSILCSYLGEKSFDAAASSPWVPKLPRKKHKIAKSKPRPRDLTASYEMNEYGAG